MRGNGRSAVLLMALGLGGVYCNAEQTGSPPGNPTAPSDRRVILEDSEVSFVESGGIAGLMTAARLQADKGALTVEYRPPGSRASTPPLSGTPTEPEYLELWRQLEGAAVWTLTGAAPQRVGADMIRYELRVRAGSRSHLIVWLEGDASPAVKAAARLAESVRQTAERAALLR
jgi:hypothetical protein